MNTQGLILVLLSACCHASWNVLTKLSNADPPSFLTKALAYSGIVYLPFFIYFQFYVNYNWLYWACAVGSGLCAGIYFFALGKAYTHGHISVAYPVARSFPILVLAWAGLLFREIPSVLAITGIALIIAGCFVLPLKRFCLGEGGFALKNYLNWSCFWAAIAAVFTSFYSIIDKYAAVNACSPDSRIAIIEKINYVYLLDLVALLVIWSGLKFSGFKFKPTSNRRTIIAGIIFLVSYSLILVAFTTNPAAYVVSIRQLSIVIGAVVSMFFIEKQFSTPRLIGVLLIFAGIILVGVG